MRSLALVLALSVAEVASAGALVSAPTTLGVTSATQLTDTYFIYPDVQMITALEDTLNDIGVASPWGQLPIGESDIESIANWVCANRDTYNIKAVLGMGDIVREAEQGDYDAVVPFRDILDGCRMVWALAYGNHEGDTIGNPQNPGTATDATLYHQTIGQDIMDTRGWFLGSRAERPDWIEYTDVDETFSTYLEDTNAYKSRSFWVPIPPFNVALPEWDYSIRISQAETTPNWDGLQSPARPWLREIRDSYPHDYWIHITHAGPCEPQNCDLTPRSLGAFFGPMGGDWSSEIESLGPNYVAFLNGHWGAGPALGCWGGGGVYANAVRDDGSAWLAGVFDFNCGTRLDPTAANNCPANGQGPPGACPGPDCLPCTSNPYTWQGWMQLRRVEGRKLCVNTIRVIDVDSDDDGIPDVAPNEEATLLALPEMDRGTLYGDPDPADPEADICTDFDSGPVTGCPNMPESCITIRDLPS